MQVDFFFAWLWVSNVFYGSGHFMVKKKRSKKLKLKKNQTVTSSMDYFPLEKQNTRNDFACGDCVKHVSFSFNCLIDEARFWKCLQMWSFKGLEKYTYSLINDMGIKFL